MSGVLTLLAALQPIPSLALPNALACKQVVVMAGGTNDFHEWTLSDDKKVQPFRNAPPTLQLWLAEFEALVRDVSVLGGAQVGGGTGMMQNALLKQALPRAALQLTVCPRCCSSPCADPGHPPGSRTRGDDVAAGSATAAVHAAAACQDAAAGCCSGGGRGGRPSGGWWEGRVPGSLSLLVCQLACCSQRHPPHPGAPGTLHPCPQTAFYLQYMAAAATRLQQAALPNTFFLQVGGWGGWEPGLGLPSGGVSQAEHGASSQSLLLVLTLALRSTLLVLPAPLRTVPSLCHTRLRSWTAQP